MTPARRRTLAFFLSVLFPLAAALGLLTVPSAEAHATADPIVALADGPAPAKAPAADAKAAPGGKSASGYDDWTADLRVMLSDKAVQVGSKVFLAILIFIAGWIFAKLAAYGVFQLLSRTDLDNRVAEKLGINMLFKKGEGEESAIERFAAKVVYYLIMLLVVVGVLEFAGLKQVAGPIEQLVEDVARALPLVGKAAIILIVGYIAGRILKVAVAGLVDRAGFDRRFAELAEEKKTTSGTPFSEAAGRVAFWLVMLFAIAGAFEALKITPIADPLQNAIDSIVAILPSIGLAAVLLIVGYFGGRIARTVVRNVLQSLGFDKLAARVQLDKLTGKMAPSDVVGFAVMVFILLQASIAALNEIGLETLSVPLTGMVGQFWDLLPSIFVSVLIVVLGVFVAGLLRGLLASALRSIGLDRFMERLGFRKLAERPDRLGEYSEMVAFAVYVAVVLLAAAQALDNLGLDTWSAYLNAFLSYVLKNVVVAVVVVGVGLAIGNYVRDVIRARSTDETAKWVAEFARYAVLVFAFTMAVRQLDVAEDFVLVTFGLLFGALCLAGALAFGLGGREVAGDIVKRRYNKAKSSIDGGSQLPPPGE